MNKVMTPGSSCTINRSSDMWSDPESHKFIDADCIIIKTCKSGLIMVQLADNPKITFCAPKRNITLK